MSLWKIVFILPVVVVVVAEAAILVQTPSGPIRGFEYKDSHAEYNVFYGIPYAKPPLNDLRFAPPVEIEPWTGEFDASNISRNRHHCYKRTYIGSDELMNRYSNEDCLKLFVYVPKSLPKNAHVLVSFPGGSFANTENAEEVEYFLNRFPNVITVSINHRVDAQGFLSLGIPEAPGNVGLMDQQMALKWTQKNIASFGGNPNDITILGVGAGSVSTGFQILAPSSRGLFQRAIMLYGVPNSPSVIATPEEAVKSTMQLATFLGCNSEDKVKVLHCLKNIHPDTFLKWTPFTDWSRIRVPFIPTIEGFQFLTDYPANLLRDNFINPVDVLIFNQFSLRHFPPHPMTKEEFKKAIENDFEKYSDEFRRSVIANYIKSESDYSNSSILLQRLDEIRQDFEFNCPALQFAGSITEKTTNRVYSGIITGVQSSETSSEMENAITLSTDDIYKLFDNFATTGNPNSKDGPMTFDKWPLFTKNEQKYLLLVPNENHVIHARVESKFKAEICSKWKTLLENDEA